jgi:hypothetical protein
LPWIPLEDLQRFSKFIGWGRKGRTGERIKEDELGDLAGLLGSEMLSYCDYEKKY